MSRQFAEVGSRIATIGQLSGVIGAMRGIAALRVQQSRSRLAGIQAYAEVISTSLARAIVSLPEQYRQEAGGGSPLFVLFCAEQGFAGGFSEKIFAAVAGEETRRVLVVGSRGAKLARAQRFEIIEVLPLMSHVEQMNGTSEALYEMLQRVLAEYGPQPVDLVFARPASGSTVTVERRRVLPLDLEIFRKAARQAPPLTNLPPEELVMALGEEYVMTLLSEALLHSYAAENVARMTAMAAARDNIVRKLEELGNEERRLRQDEITSEILELVTFSSAAFAS